MCIVQARTSISSALLVLRMVHGPCFNGLLFAKDLRFRGRKLSVVERGMCCTNRKAVLVHRPGAG